jgi:hypothetical protein
MEGELEASDGLLEDGDHLGIIGVCAEDGAAFVAPGCDVIPGARDVDSRSSGH